MHAFFAETVANAWVYICRVGLPLCVRLKRRPITRALQGVHHAHAKKPRTNHSGHPHFGCGATILGTAAAQKASVPKPQDKLAMGEDEVKQLLLLMNTDSKGQVSKQEYMKFMEAEFEHLDKNKKGELNVKELTKSDLTASRFVGK
jgi:hypothetical protein